VIDTVSRAFSQMIAAPRKPATSHDQATILRTRIGQEERRSSFTFSSNRRHPLHVLVHLGLPGADGDIAVKGSAEDPCAATGNYVNG
jgi:hypothetical protein